MSERANGSPRIVAIDSNYEPGYPRSLTAEEYRALIEPDGGRRMLAAAAAAGFGLAGCLQAEGARGEEEPVTSSREQHVLEVLRTLSGDRAGRFSRADSRGPSSRTWRRRRARRRSRASRSCSATR